MKTDPRMLEASVKLDRVFPLMGDMVRRQGIDLPLPFGVSVAYRNQDMDIPMTDYVIGGVRLNDLFDPEDSIATVKAESLSIRGDVNILPFWNVFGYVGKVNVDANVDPFLARYHRRSCAKSRSFLWQKLRARAVSLHHLARHSHQAPCVSDHSNLDLDSN